MDSKIVIEKDLMRVVVSGRFDLQSSQRVFLEMLEAVKQHHSKKVLFDGRAISGEPTTMERFHYGEFVAREYVKHASSFRTLPKFAYLLSIPVLDPQRFGENVAVNRGMPARMFDKLENALAWLDINQPDSSGIGAMLLEIISTRAQELQQLKEDESSLHPAPGKWSKKEELGHLIDSAHNNLRRFIVAQYETEPHVIYGQDKWVELNNYNSQPVIQLARLWLLLNHQIEHILSNMTEEMWMRKCNTGKAEPSLHTLKWLAEDYVKHLLHHLHHILELEPMPY